MTRHSDQKFLALKNQTLDNLEVLRTRVDFCIEQGMLDTESFLYNEVITLIDDVGVIHTYPELSEIIVRAKEIENNIDVWLVNKGFSNISLNWPALPV
jgi:hypothetical protein